MRKEKKHEKKEEKTAAFPVYLNTPVTEQKNDIIGFDTCASALEEAINHGAQMIAITSPFGAGKTSIIELLKEKRTQYKKYINRKRRKREKIIHIPMWSQLSEKNVSSIDLHKHLVYQIAKEINTQKGTYIRRRLSENYGLVKFHINRKRYLIAIIFAVALWLLGGFIKEQTEFLTELFPILEGYFPVIDIGLKAIGVLVAIYPILKSEIIISSPKSEKNRKIEEDEIIDLYRNEIVQPYTFFPWFKHRYIIVIEDIDRSSANEVVLSFLKELRKYYMPEGQQFRKVRNEMVYIVNIKPESLMIIENDQQKENIYAKIFDFVLNIQTIHIDDYETILNSLLEKQKDRFIQIGIIDKKYAGKLSDITGMQWLIRGKKLDIRKIKHRINRSVIAYQSLKERFGEDISFEKCSVYAYLSTDFEEALQTLDDNAFDKLIEMRIERAITPDDCADVGMKGSEDFINAICELINSRHIDNYYRMYFYNHPKGSRIYTYDERCVQNAILYEEYDEKLNDIVHNVIESKSNIIQLSLLKRKQLGLAASRAVFSSDYLFGEALHYVPTSITEWVDGLNYSDDKIEETIKTIIRILHLDSNRSYYKGDIANEFCHIWELKDKATPFISELRKSLCASFPHEIIWYKKLFLSPNNPITSDELELIPFDSALDLIDIENDDFKVADLKKLIDCFDSQSDYTLYTEKVQFILDEAVEKFIDEEMAYVLLQFMKKVKCLIPRYEEILTNNMNMEDLSEDQIFIEYQELVNMLSENELPENTLENISKLEFFSGYSESVIQQLYDNGYFIEAVIMLMLLNKEAPYDELPVINAVTEYKEWLVEVERFEQIRYHIVCCTHDIFAYKFMFEKTDPPMSADEFHVLKNKISVVDMLRLLHAPWIDGSLAELLVEYWNSTILSRENIFQIMIFISTMQANIAKDSFEQLDFARIHYYKLSKPQRNEVKNSFINILKLNELENRLNYMALTRFADNEWITEDSPLIISNDEMEIKFVNIVKDCYPHSITPPVLRTIRRLHGAYAMTEQIEKKLLERRMYKKYIESKILRLQTIEFGELDENNPLWNAYIQVFVETSNKDILECYSNDIPFLSITMKHKTYRNLPQTKRRYYAKINQDAACLYELVNNDNYDSAFVLSYLSNIHGFADYEAASAFITIVEKHAYILASDEVYNNTHDKLLNPALKGKYTKKRNL